MPNRASLLRAEAVQGKAAQHELLREYINQTVTRFHSGLISRLDQKLLTVSSISSIYLKRIDSFQDPIDDILRDLETDSFVKELVVHIVRCDD